MKMQLKSSLKYIIFISFFLLLMPFHTRADSSPMVRVLIMGTSQKVSIMSEGKIRIKTGQGEDLGVFKPREGNPLEFLPLQSGIKFSDKESKSKILELIPSDEKPIQIGLYAYRGDVLIHLNTQWKLEVINRLGVEEYVMGLMKAEISPAWSYESLKAQAVVARTYTLYQLDRHQNGVYDLKASTDSQVYPGIAGEDPKTNMAVMETKGQVLITPSGYLPALYHACCGGHTEDAQYVFHDHPALIGVSCAYCMDSPHYTWESQMTPIQLRNLFLRQYYKMGPIRSVRIMERTPNGGVETLLITHKLGQDIINGKQLRMLIGNNIIRSLKFDITRDKEENFIFKGYGWGHGVGLCQWGAKALAEQGASYRDILSHYYPMASLDMAY